MDYTETVVTPYMTKAIHASISPEDWVIRMGSSTETLEIGNHDSVLALYGRTFSPREQWIITPKGEMEEWVTPGKDGIEAKLDGVKTGGVSNDPEDWVDEPNKAYSTEKI